MPSVLQKLETGYKRSFILFVFLPFLTSFSWHSHLRIGGLSPRVRPVCKFVCCIFAKSKL